MTDTKHTDSVEATNEVNYETREYDGIRWIRHDHYEHALATLQATQSQQVEEAVERVAKAIYDEMVCDDPRGKPDWVPGGNSIKQNEARRKALQALTPNHQD